MKRFEDKVVIITGGTSGIGQTTATLFARDGAKVVVCGRNEEGGQKTLQLIEDFSGQGLYIKCDVSKPNEVELAIKKTVETFGKLNIAVNNAGVRSEHAKTENCTEDIWNYAIDNNLKSIWYCMKYEIPEMLKNEKGGAIVNTSSVLGEIAIPNMPAYIASKHGVNGLTKSAAIEYAKDPYHPNGSRVIRVNAVAPGYIRSPIQEESLKDPEVEAKKASMHAMGRIGSTEEVANGILWLCSDEASFITGAILPIDGGMLAGRWSS